MGMLHRVRLVARMAGIDVKRWPGRDPAHILSKLLNHYEVSTVLDVGANSGQYGRELRRAGYQGRILSFEPLPDPYSELSAQAAKDPLWDAYQCAIGDAHGLVTMNVAGAGGESSSVLPMLDAHREACPERNYVGTVETRMRTLDEVTPDSEVFLKLDVQGFERQALAGAGNVLSRCVGMQLELSFTPLYEGGMLYREVLDFANSLGFELMGLTPMFNDPRSGRLLQADGVFMRGPTPIG